MPGMGSKELGAGAARGRPRLTQVGLARPHGPPAPNEAVGWTSASASAIAGGAALVNAPEHPASPTRPDRQNLRFGDGQTRFMGLVSRAS